MLGSPVSPLWVGRAGTVSRVAAAFTPSDIDGGFHLASDYGVTKSVSTLTAWAHRGSLNPGFVVKGTGLTVDANADIDFPASATAFLYEGTPIDNYDNHTIFGLYRRDLVNVAAGETLIGKYVTTGNHRSWQIAHQPTSVFAVQHFANSDGAGTLSTNTFGPTASGWNFFVARKSGTDLDSWFNGIATLNATTQNQLFDITEPICIGGRSGDASTNIAAPIDCAIRDIGFYNSALSDANVELLNDYLASRM